MAITEEERVRKAFESNAMNNNYSTQYDDTTAQLEREGNYKSYFNKQIQLANVNRMAQKYLNSSLQQTGLQNSGQASTASIQLSNNFTNSFLQNAQAYADENARITANSIDRMNTENANGDAQLASYIANARDYNSAIGYMQRMGFMDSNGEYTDTFNNLDPSRKNFLMSAIEGSSIGSVNSAKAIIGASNIKGYDPSELVGGTKAIQFYGKDGKLTGMGDMYFNNNGLADFRKIVETNPMEYNGTAFRVAGLNGRYAYVLYLNGKYYQLNQNQYTEYMSRGGKTKNYDYKNGGSIN